MPGKGGGRWQQLLEDEDLRRWYDNLSRGSVATADNYLRTLGRFLGATGQTHKGLLKLSAKKRDDLVFDYVSDLVKAGRAGSYIAITKKVIVSWLEWNGERLNRKIKIPNRSHRPSLKDAHIPTQEELKKVLNVADARARSAIALMAFSGLRPEVLGSYLGDDGLRVADFVEANIEHGELVFSTVPTKILVPERMSKTGRPYFTFLGPEGCEYLTSWFQERKENGEKLNEKSPIITPKKVEKPFMRTLNVSDLIRKPMRAAGLKEPPYMWRSYFASRAMLAEGKGFTRDYRQFCMGHVGDIEHVYALHKQLPPDTIEAMRKGYEAALEFLETGPRQKGEDPTLKMIGVLLQAAGYSEKDLEEMDLASKSEEEPIALLKRAPEGARGPANEPTHAVRKGSQRIIPLQRLEWALSSGWTFRAVLPDGRAVIEASPPGHTLRP